jgi:hypothetical protein
MDTSTVIALISLIIAVLTLFLSNLQPAKITSKVGPFIRIYYTDYDSGESFGLYLPATFLNLTPQTSTVLNAAITLARKDSDEQIYFMQWKQFSKLDPVQDKWVTDEMAHALAVPSKSSVAKIIWFIWGYDSQPRLILREGIYRLKFYFWENKKSRPRCETHEFFVSESLAQKLESYRAQKKSTTHTIRLDLEIDENRLLTRHEAERLLD